MATNPDDVPGASLCGRNPETLKIPELKQWLLCRVHQQRGERPISSQGTQLNASPIKYIARS